GAARAGPSCSLLRWRSPAPRVTPAPRKEPVEPQRRSEAKAAARPAARAMRAAPSRAGEPSAPRRARAPGSPELATPWEEPREASGVSADPPEASRLSEERRAVLHRRPAAQRAKGDQARAETLAPEEPRRA